MGFNSGFKGLKQAADSFVNPIACYSTQHSGRYPPPINSIESRKKQQKQYSNIYPTRRNIIQFILSGNCSTFSVCKSVHHHIFK